MRHIVLVSIATTLVMLFCPAAPADELEDEHILSTSFVTPHVEWAKPYAGGTVRALFFVGGRGTAPREVVELMQRFDLDAQAVYFSREGPIHGDEDGQRRLMRLLGETFDVYVFGNVRFDALPVEAQYRVLRAVSEGKGMVCVGPRPASIMRDERRVALLPPFLSRGTPLMALPAAQPAIQKTKLQAPDDADAANAICKIYRLGQGRGAHVEYGCPTNALCPRLDFSFDALTEYEYWSAFMGRVIIWAAQKEPKTELVSGSPLVLQRSPTPGKPISVWFAGDPNLQVSVQVRRNDGQMVQVQAQPAPRVSAPGEQYAPPPPDVSAVLLSIPKLRAGQYFIEAIARRDGKVENFATLALQVISADGVDSVTLDRDFAEITERIAGRAVLRGDLAGKTVRIRLRDNWGREITRTDLQPKAGPDGVPFEFRVPEAATTLTRVEAVLVDADGSEIHQAQASFLVPHRNRGRFNFVMWDSPTDALGYYACRRMKQVGISVFLGSPAMTQAANDMPIIPYTTRILDTYDANKVMKPCCWNNAAEIDQYIEGIANSAKTVGARKQGAFAYSLGDETTTKGCCLHPACLAAYREWLRKQYGTIAALNAEWDSNYQSFDDVNVLQPGDNFEDEAKKQGLYARWYDRQAFARYNFCRLCERFDKRFKQLDPQALTGFEGAGKFGEDYQEIITTNGFWSPYPSLGDEIVRSLAPRGFPRSNWMGYSKTADPLIAKAWRMILNGSDSVWWWRWDGIGQYHGYLAPHLDLWPATRELAEEMRVIREGLGDLLLHAHMQHDQVAILYSLPSAWAAKVGNSSEFDDILAAHQAAVSITQDLGLQFLYVTDKMLEQDGLDNDKFRLLILPFTQAVSEKTAETIRRFVTSGGTVLADLRPGVYSGHCKPRPAGVLDDLFGVKHEAPGQAKICGLSIDAALEGHKLRLSLEATRLDAKVTLAGGQALSKAEDVPALIVRQQGKGRAILLNFSLSPYASLRSQAREKELLDFARELFAAAGVKPPLAATGADGAPLRFTQIVRWRDGSAEIIALCRTAGEEPTAQIRLPQAQHVYALQDGKYLGQTDRFSATLPLGRARFFAVLPYQPGPPRIRPAQPEVQRGATQRLEITVPRPAGATGAHALLINGRLPDGGVAEWMRRVVIAEDGRAVIDLPIAFDDPAGTWTITAHELYAGQSGSATYKVAP